MSALADVARIDGSLPAAIVAALIEQYGLEGAHERIDELLDQCSTVELAAHEADWKNVWARPKQIPPSWPWESCGHLQGRGTGKTKGLSHFVNEEVEAGRAPLVCLIAQDEDSSVKLHITGPSGLIATAPPWFKPEWHASDLELWWPDGSKAYVRTPEVPGKIRGLEYNLAWASELQSWPNATMDEAWMNVLISTRLGLARVLWDATAKRRHPLLTRLVKEGKENPRRNVVVTGSTYENCLNLGRGYIEKIERRYGGTRQGEEELFGRLFDDADGATVKATSIQRAPAPARYVRRAIGVDAAVTKRDGNDSTGIIDAGLGPDGRAYICEDVTKKYSPDEWATVVLNRYEAGRCDCVVVETNKGGDLVTHTLRAAGAARLRPLKVIVLGKDEKPRHIPGTVYVREVHARGEKADRAKPLGTAYEGGRVVHVEGANLTELENVLTTWVPSPGARSPDRLDAEVHVVNELLNFASNETDPSIGMKGIEKLAAEVLKPSRPIPPSLAAFFGTGRNGRI